MSEKMFGICGVGTNFHVFASNKELALIRAFEHHCHEVEITLPITLYEMGKPVWVIDDIDFLIKYLHDAGVYARTKTIIIL